jgi:2-polyprenyl-6-methoxyphenol hydroxylase-like FAD-dependent oxidoreductase
MKTLISGSGIAGPTFAYWLARTRADAEITIVERAPTLRDGGYAVDVRGAAMTVLERMGLCDAVRRLETDTEVNAVVDARGRRFGQMPRGFGVVEPGDVEIDRGDLSRLIAATVSDEARVRTVFDDAIASLDASGERVYVTFESGRTGEYDLVVGADGVHSRARRLAFSPEAVSLHPLGSWLAIFSAPNFLGLKREQLLFSATGRIASVKPARGDEELRVCVFFEMAEDAAYDPHDVVSQKREVARAFGDAGWEFPRLLEAMDRSRDFYCDVTCQVRMNSYHAGRVVLVGDAAYCPSPLSGQGTSLALVGAYVLAASIAESPHDVPAALDAYSCRMCDYVRENQRVGEKIAKGFAPATPFGVWSRNVVMRLLPYLPGARRWMKGSMGGVERAANAITLPQVGSGRTSSIAA